MNVRNPVEMRGLEIDEVRFIGDPRTFWKIVKKISPSGKKNVQTRNVQIYGITSADEKSIADNFNHFFVGLIKPLTELFGKNSDLNTNASLDLKSSSLGSFHFASISETFVYNQLKKLKTSKAVGLDELPARLLKDSADVIYKPLTTIFNVSQSEGQVPQERKSAKVIPIFKGGKAEEMENHRPISVLPVVSKVLERAVHTQLRGFLHEKILSPYQCGFRKGHSTESAVISFTDNIRRNMDQGMLTGAVFIELRKALDTVNHEPLLGKLRLYGIKDKELEWFKGYLNNRTNLF